MQTKCYFEVRVFSPSCDSNKNFSMADDFAKIEKIKNKDYADQIKHMLGSNFNPCIFSSCDKGDKRHSNQRKFQLFKKV